MPHKDMAVHLFTRHRLHRVFANIALAVRDRGDASGRIKRPTVKWTTQTSVRNLTTKA